MTVDGEVLRNTATFTNDVPDGPVVISPEEDDVVDLNAVIIDWEPVTSPPGIEVVGYEVSFAPEDPEEGRTRRPHSTSTCFSSYRPR